MENCNMAGACNCNCVSCKAWPKAHCGRHRNECHDSCQRTPAGGRSGGGAKNDPNKRRRW